MHVLSISLLLFSVLAWSTHSVQASSPPPSPPLATTPSRCISTNDTCWPSPELWNKLNYAMAGSIVLPGNPAWKDMKFLRNARLSIVPGAVAFPLSSEDVMRVVSFAHEKNLLISIKSTGHCYSGNCMAKNSLNIDLSKMKKLMVDTESMVMYVEPGSNFEDMYTAADAARVQVVGGMCPTVGPAGYSMGGGHGPLVRSYGLGSDNVVSFEMVTATGELVNVSAQENTELFWALRGGGGGSYGVVTSMKFRVYPAPDQLVSLSCAYPLSVEGKPVGEAILAEWFSTIMPDLPNEFAFYTAMIQRPIPGLYMVKGWNYLTMNGLLILEGLYNGPYSATLMDASRPLLSMGKAHQLKCDFRNYTSFKAWHDQAWFGKGGPTPFRSYMASSFAQADLDAKNFSSIMTKAITQLPWDDSILSYNMMFGVQLGGKVSTPDLDSAISPAFRNATAMQELDADWVSSWFDSSMEQWVDEVGGAMSMVKGMRGSYVNEANPSLPRHQWGELFWGKENFARLQRVKATWDPQSFFTCTECVYNENERT